MCVASDRAASVKTLNVKNFKIIKFRYTFFIIL